MKAEGSNENTYDRKVKRGQGIQGGRQAREGDGSGEERGEQGESTNYNMLCWKMP